MECGDFLTLHEYDYHSGENLFLLGIQPLENWSAETINIKCYVFTEDLSQ